MFEWKPWENLPPIFPGRWVNKPEAQRTVVGSVADFLTKQGFSVVPEPGTQFISGHADLLAVKKPKHFLFEFKVHKHEYLTYDSIAQVKSLADRYREKVPGEEVVPFVVGSFAAVPEGAEFIAKENGVHIINIPSGLRLSAVPEFINNNLAGIIK